MDGAGRWTQPRLSTASSPVLTFRWAQVLGHCHHHNIFLKGVIATALARRGQGGQGGIKISQGVSQKTSFAPAISQVRQVTFNTPAISQVVSRPQVTRVTPSFTSSTQSSGVSNSRNSAEIVTRVLNSLSPSIQRAVAR